MEPELVKTTSGGVPAVSGGPSLPALVERAGGAARFACDEFFCAEHHNPHTQKTYMRAVKRFLAWAEGQGRSYRKSRQGNSMTFYFLTSVQKVECPL